MSKANQQYYEKISKILSNIMETQGDSMETAAVRIAEHLAQDKRLFVFGTASHCTRAAEELFYRSGGLACVRPILDPALQIVNGVTRAGKVERHEGYAKIPLDYYGVGEGDLMLLVNAYGVNALSIDTVDECKKRGVPVIAVTSFEFPASVPQGHPARHSTGRNLHEIADIAINNFVPAGDSVVKLEGFPHTVAASSAIADMFILNALVARIVELLLEKRMDPPVWVSANAPGGDEWNRKFIAKYAGIRHL